MNQKYIEARISSALYRTYTIYIVAKHVEMQYAAGAFWFLETQTQTRTQTQTQYSSVSGRELPTQTQYS